MNKLSTGHDSTLGNWYDLAVRVFGEDSPATQFLADKIASQGRDEEVIADEGQLLMVLGQLHNKGAE